MSPVVHRGGRGPEEGRTAENVLQASRPYSVGRAGATLAGSPITRVRSHLIQSSHFCFVSFIFKFTLLIYNLHAPKPPLISSVQVYEC